MNGKLKQSIIFSSLILFSSSINTTHAELVAIWDFDCKTVQDSCGVNHGILNGDPRWVTRGHGTALQLDGIDDYVYCNGNIDLKSSNNITITTWIKTEDAGDNLTKCYVFSDTGGLRHYQNNIEFILNIDGQWNRVQFPIDGSFNGLWHHLAGTYDGTELRLYIDGNLKETSVSAGRITTNNTGIAIGKNSTRTGHVFKGQIDDICIFNDILTKNDIEQLYIRGDTSLFSKDYATQMVQEAEDMSKKLEPKDRITYLEKKIAEFEKWKADNPNNLMLQDSYPPSDIRVLLARAKETAGAPEQEVVALYKKSITQPQWPSNYIPAALLWLSDKIPTNEYISVVTGYINNDKIPCYNIPLITGYFAENDKWDAFILILDVIFSKTDNITSYTQTVSDALKANDVWAGKFAEYCQGKPECTKFVFNKQEMEAESYIQQKDFKKAAQVYQNIIDQCAPHQEKNIYELKLYECIFDDGQYEAVVKNIDSFIEANKATQRTMTARAIKIKGHSYVYMGESESAIDTFLKLIIEYPQTEQAIEANFIMGYCLMLQGNFEEATQAFNLLINDYPKSGYVAQAESYLKRIKNMTD